MEDSLSQLQGAGAARLNRYVTVLGASAGRTAMITHRIALTLLFSSNFVISRQSMGSFPPSLSHLPVCTL